MVPHGQSVSLTAPEAFRFSFDSAPDRHLRRPGSWTRTRSSSTTCGANIGDGMSAEEGEQVAAEYRAEAAAIMQEVGIAFDACNVPEMGRFARVWAEMLKEDKRYVWDEVATILVDGPRGLSEPH